MDGKESVLAKFDTHSDKLIHWKIYYGNEPKPSWLTDSTEHFKTIDKVISRKKLVEALDRLPADEYLIQFKSSATGNNNIINHRFAIGREYNTSANPNSNLPAMRGYISAEHAEEKTKAALANRDIQDLKEQIRDLRTEKDSSFKALAGELLKEHLPILIGLLKGNAQLEPRPRVVNGPAPGTEAQERKQYFLGLNKEATEGLYTEDDFGTMHPSEYGIVLLWCINEFRKENEEMFNNIKPQLLKYAERLEQQKEEEQE